MSSYQTATAALASLLHLPETSPALQALEGGWAESEATFGRDRLRFLDTNAIEEAVAFSGFDRAWLPSLRETAEEIRRSPALARLAWHGWRLAYGHPDPVNFSTWPELEAALGPRARLFYLLLALACVEPMRRSYAALGAPEIIARAGLLDLTAKVERSALSRPDLPGMAARELSWFQHHADASVFRLGRLQFRFRPFRGDLRLFRHRREGHYLALAEEGLHFEADGFRASEGGDTGWRSNLRRGPHSIEGHPILREGRARRETVVLKLDEWAEVAAHGDEVFEIHVPPGGNLRLEGFGDSLREAVAFRRRFFPGRPLPALFSCISWFLGPQLREILPATSNIVRLQQASYLFPVSSAANNGIYFLFGLDTLPAPLPETATSLQRAIHAHLAAGGAWRAGGMLVPIDEADSFGKTDGSAP